MSCLCLDKANHATAHSGRNKNLIRILESFVILPAITVAMPLGGLFGMMQTSTTQGVPQIVLAQQNIGANTLFAFNQAQDEKVQTLEAQAKAIDAYFGAYNMPLKGTGMKMAEEAHKNGLDWRLIPAIAVRESTGGKFACKSVSNSFFGWGSCKISFKSKDEAIESIARNLSGNNPNTDHHYPKGQTTLQILKKYNPPSIVPKYADQVMAIMDAIGTKDLGTTKPTEKTVAINT